MASHFLNLLRQLPPLAAARAIRIVVAAFTPLGAQTAIGPLTALGPVVALAALIAIVATTGSLCTVVAQEPRVESTKRHWAYVAPERAVVPRTVRRDWSRGPVDQFIAARLEQNGLTGGGQQDRERLLRRITHSLTGLSPTVEQLDEFLADDAPDALEKTVDRLLASPRRGEHRAAAWLDLARYADTHGYHADTHREMWRWRDWVIEAFNRGMPFSQFTVEQLAGDLLPSPTLDQRIATGFNRNHMVIFENGVIAEEYRTEYVLDRASTVGTVWLGQTLQCARCHDHKHDPWSQRDFYRFAAFFNNVPENGVDGQYGNAVPFISAPTPLQQEQLARLESRRTAAERTLAARREARPDAAELAWRAAQRKQTSRGAAPPADAAWHLPLDEQDGSTTRAAVPQGRELKVPGQPNWGAGRRAGALVLDGETSVSLEQAASCDRFEPLSAALWAFPTGDGPMTLLAKYDGDETQRGFVWSTSNRKLVWSLTARADSDERLEVRTRQPLAARRWQHLAFTYDGAGKAAGVALFVDGQRQEVEVVHDALNSSARTSTPLVLGRRGADAGWRGLLDDFRLFARSLSSAEIAALADRDPLGELLAAPDDKRSREQESQLHLAYLERADAGYQAATREVELLDQDLRTLRKSIPTTMVMEELPTPRAAHVLLRGQYDQLGDEVEAGWPEWLSRPSKKAQPQPQTRSQKRTSTSSQRAADELPFTRLELALWLVSPDNPLTARVQVDRVWRELFGRGFVSTPEDWGTHGAAPTHPELLDWLAVEWPTRWEWDLKRLERELVTSATFRQSTRGDASRVDEARIDKTQVDEARAKIDPDNRLWSCGPRVRLGAESVRDQSLAAAGLLDGRLGGPSVFPYQPAGLWEEVAYDTQALTAQAYVTSRGRDLYRRSLYTFWKRAVPPPTLSAFDAPDRELCTVARASAISPQQALILMNELGQVEAAREFARRAAARHERSERKLAAGDGTENVKPRVAATATAAATVTSNRNAKDGAAKPNSVATADVDATLSWMFRTATSRLATDDELAVLRAAYREQRAAFVARPAAAREFLAAPAAPSAPSAPGAPSAPNAPASGGESPMKPVGDDAEDDAEAVHLAALARVARLILSLDESQHR